MEVPPSLKSLAPYIKLSKQFEARDPVVSYYCQLYFVQNGIKIAGKDNESKTFLFGVMDRLEQVKKGLIDQGQEAVSNDIVASSHIESKALQLFIFADREDRASNFDVKVIKAFYTASLLFGLISMFGEISEEVAHQQKYAKWKTTYLEKCRKTGEEPVPGPQLHEEEEAEEGGYTDQQPGPSGDYSTQQPYNTTDQPAYNQPAYNQPSPPTFNQPTQPAYNQAPQPAYNQAPQPAYNQAPQPAYNQAPQPAYNQAPQPAYNQPLQPAYNQPTFDPPPSSFNPPAQPTFNPPPAATQQPPVSGVSTPGQSELLRLDLNQHVELPYAGIERVQKLCRFAGSALNYKDFKSCIENLQKAINLVRVGKEE